VADRDPLGFLDAIPLYPCEAARTPMSMMRTRTGWLSSQGGRLRTGLVVRAASGAWANGAV